MPALDSGGRVAAWGIMHHPDPGPAGKGDATAFDPAHHRGQHGGRRGLGLCDPGYDPRSRFQGEANAIMPYLMRLSGIVAGFSEPNTQTGS